MGVYPYIHKGIGYRLGLEDTNECRASREGEVRMGVNLVHHIYMAINTLPKVIVRLCTDDH